MNNIIDTIIEEKLIVIVRGVASEKLIPLCEAMYKGGVRVLEITYSADGSVSHEETAQNIKKLAEAFDGKMYIGAGTVLTEYQVELTKKAGGSFIISPDTNPAVIKKTKELGMVSIPGSLTPTEIQLAHSSGADFVKLFPVTAFGSEYVKSVKAPLSHIRFLAVGGISENDIREYLDAGVCGFGLGSNIIDKKALESGNYSAITDLARKFTTLVKKQR